MSLKTALCFAKKLLGKDLRSEEYEYLQALQLKLGTQNSIHNGIYVTLREIVRPDLTMLEFWHPDNDIAAYIVK